MQEAPITDTPQMESEVIEIIEDDDPIIFEDVIVERIESAIEKLHTRTSGTPENFTSKSPIITQNDTIIESKQKKDIITVVPSPENSVKKCTSRETRTDFVNQIDGLPTPTGSEDRNNEDPMSFIVNKPLVYTPILPTPVIDSDSDTDNSKNEIRSQSPTTSQECPAEEIQNSSVNISQICG